MCVCVCVCPYLTLRHRRGGGIRRHTAERMMRDKAPPWQTVHQKTDLTDNKDLKPWCSGFESVTLTHNNLLSTAGMKEKPWMILTCGGVRDMVSEKGRKKTDKAFSVSSETRQFHVVCLVGRAVYTSIRTTLCIVFFSPLCHYNHQTQLK